MSRYIVNWSRHIGRYIAPDAFFSPAQRMTPAHKRCHSQPLARTRATQPPKGQKAIGQEVSGAMVSTALNSLKRHGCRSERSPSSEGWPSGKASGLYPAVAAIRRKLDRAWVRSPPLPLDQVLPRSDVFSKNSRSDLVSSFQQQVKTKKADRSLPNRLFSAIQFSVERHHATSFIMVSLRPFHVKIEGDSDG